VTSKLIVFDANSLLKLLVHYSDGAAVPLDAELQAVRVNPLLQRCVALDFETREPGPQIAQVRYEGKRVLVWHEAGTPAVWQEGNERPRGKRG
jgi:hypothetical protein